MDYLTEGEEERVQAFILKKKALGLGFSRLLPFIL
ncbi:MAG: hypothetical protein Ct9H300mP3_05690 [Gammaproteobacteria bacterium]|nr:MAG: hypothetical protein Ct9H300mP3_05690 [Gammaproteobacteria bacterium]